MQRQSRHNRLVVNTPDQASCDVFRPCPPGWAPFICPPQIDWMSDQPVQFAFTAGTFEQDGMLSTGYSNGQTEIPPIGAIIGPSPSGGLDIVDISFADAAMSGFAAVSGTGQPPLWARPAHVSISGTAGSIGLQAPTYDAGYDLWAMPPPYSPDDPTPPLGLVAGQNYCVTITFDTPLLQPGAQLDPLESVIFGFVAGLGEVPGGPAVGVATAGGPFAPFGELLDPSPAGFMGAIVYMTAIGGVAGEVIFDGLTNYIGGEYCIYDSSGAQLACALLGDGEPLATVLVVGETYYVKITQP